MANWLRRLRAVLGNALVWGAGWFAGVTLVGVVLRLVGGGLTSAAFTGILQAAARAGVVGGIAAAAFSAFIALRYQGRRLADINWLRFTIGGAIVTGLFIPVFIIVMRFLSGDPFLAWQSLGSNALFGMVFGGAAAGVSLKLAQVADKYLPARKQRPELSDESDL